MLTMMDRAAIARGLEQGWSLRRIAERIGRDVSVVCREVARNRRACGYRPVGADVAAQRRRARPKTRKIDACPTPGSQGAGRPGAFTLTPSDRRAAASRGR